MTECIETVHIWWPSPRWECRWTESNHRYTAARCTWSQPGSCANTADHR